jgi:ACS family glucarate transporter-like MFS transporter
MDQPTTAGSARVLWLKNQNTYRFPLICLFLGGIIISMVEKSKCLSVIATAADSDHQRTRVRWVILALLFMASFVAYVLRTNMSIAGESIMTDLGLSRIQFGVVLSAFAWGYAIFQFPGGIFGDLVGCRRALTVIAVLWGGLTLVTGLVPGMTLASTAFILTTLVVLRFLVGVVQAPLFPVTCGGTIGNWFPVSGWAFPNGLTSTGLTLGAAATAPLIAWLMETLGWRWSFIVTAPLAFLIAGFWWWYARDNPADHPRVSKKELDLINANRPWPKPAIKDKTAWKRVLKNRDILLLTASYFCMNYVFYIFFNWFFIYLVDVREFAIMEGGYFAAAPWIVGAIAASIGGLWCDRLCKRIGFRWGCRIPGIVGLSLVAGLLFLGAKAENPYLAVVFLSLSFGCTQLTEGAYWAAAISVSGKHASAAAGVMNTGGNVVGGIGALLVPITAEAFGWVPALATGSVFAMIGVVLWLFVRAEKPMVLVSGDGSIDSARGPVENRSDE